MKRLQLKKFHNYQVLLMSINTLTIIINRFQELKENQRLGEKIKV